MHLIAGFILWTMQYFTTDKFVKKDIIPALCIFGTYAAFYMDGTLDHFAFQPWWVVTLVGLRNREFLIWIGGIYIGVYLQLSPLYTVIAHVLINICTMFRIRKISFKSRAVVHIACMIIYANDPHITDVGYRDFLAGLSAVVCAMIETRPDVFAMAMIFNSPLSLSTFFLHMLEPNWYQFYKNNHFRKVKNSFYFIYPILIVALALGVPFESFSVF